MKQEIRKFLTIVSSSLLIFFSSSVFGQVNDVSEIFHNDLQELKSENIKIKGSVSFFGHRKSTVITNSTKLNQLIRKGANEKLCEKILRGYKLEEQTLIGINILTDSYKEPKISDQKIYFNKHNNTLTVYIDYEQSENISDKLISHPYWFKIPLIGDNVKVIYHIRKYPNQFFL